MSRYNYVIVRNGQLITRCESEEEMIEIISNDMTGELEAYPYEEMQRREKDGE